MARNISMEEGQLDIHKMVLLLATVYESARLVPPGSLIQRCSLKHGKTSNQFLRSLIFCIEISLTLHLCFCVLCVNAVQIMLHEILTYL